MSGLTVSGCGDDGLYFADTKNVRVRRVNISSCGGYGLNSENFREYGLHEVTVSECGLDGARVAPNNPLNRPAYAKFSECAFPGNTRNGLSNVPQTDGTYVFQLTVVDASGNGKP